ncbi:MAG: electron transport complex subunit RsxC, partial [Plesiomonas sp.]
GHDTWYERQIIDDYHLATPEALIAQIRSAGIAGLGGAGFPTAAKLLSGSHLVKLLIINAAECEPYITADDRLMQDYADEVIEGARILRHILRPEQVVIGIEDNKSAAINALKNALSGSEDIQLRIIPTKYPSGGAKQLIKILTGCEVPKGKHSSAIGVLMQNVGTAFAIKRAIVNGEPLIERVVTMTGDAIHDKGNVWARLGTPVQHLLDHASFRPTQTPQVIVGGPLMGFSLPHLDVPVVKITNCILAPGYTEFGQPQPEQACIRCSSCADACPVSLLPQQLYWFSRGQDHDKASQYNIMDCIECGACAYVCPSNIPLVQYYRQEKSALWEIRRDERKAEVAKQRFEARQLRLQREKEERELRASRAAEARRSTQKSTDGVDPVQAALERIKAKKAQTQAQEGSHTDVPQITQIRNESTTDLAGRTIVEQNAAIAAREMRKQQAREQKARKAALESQETADTTPVVTEPVTATPAAAQVEDADPRKAAVAAAIARAKARKAAQGTQESADTIPVVTEPVTAMPAAAQVEDADPRKAAVAAAIARAKARKATQGTQESADTAPVVTEPVTATPAATQVENTDPRKAAVAAAIARAKARKAAQGTQESADTAPVVTEPATATPAATQVEDADPRKAAVAAAIARAKARKAAQGTQESADTTPVVTEPVTVTPAATQVEDADPRKAAVAAAIARAKARKAAQTTAAQTDNSSTIHTEMREEETNR